MGENINLIENTYNKHFYDLSSTYRSTRTTHVTFAKAKITLFLDDGRDVTKLLEWLPKFRDASIVNLEDLRLVRGGEGIDWEALDEDLLVEHLL